MDKTCISICVKVKTVVYSCYCTGLLTLVLYRKDWAEKLCYGVVVCWVKT